MSLNRVVSLAAAIVITAIQVTALSRPLSHAESVAAAAAVSIADDPSDGALPVIVVTAHNALGPWTQRSCYSTAKARTPSVRPGRKGGVDGTTAIPRLGIDGGLVLRGDQRSHNRKVFDPPTQQLGSGIVAAAGDNFALERHRATSVTDSG
jgi:hypothetical protein